MTLCMLSLMCLHASVIYSGYCEPNIAGKDWPFRACNRFLLSCFHVAPFEICCLPRLCYILLHLWPTIAEAFSTFAVRKTTPGKEKYHIKPKSNAIAIKIIARQRFDRSFTMPQIRAHSVTFDTQIRTNVYPPCLDPLQEDLANRLVV